MAFKDYRGQTVGFARVMADVPYGDGTTALEIVNFRIDNRGVLDSTFRIMPLIPKEWRGADHPQPFKLGVFAIGYMRRYGEVPELLFLTTTGVFRYAPWRRAAGGANAGLEEQFYWDHDNSQSSVTPQGRMRYPPQVVSVGNRIYFTFCDGAGAWVWDGDRLRPFGYTTTPSPPTVDGPQRTDTDYDLNPNANLGGFSVKGRIGNLESGWTTIDSDPVGGIDNGEWQYALVWEGTDGAYSATSSPGGVAVIRYELADPSNGTMLEDLRRRFRLENIPEAPPGTTAALIVRTRNRLRLPANDDGSFRFVHRLVGNQAFEWIDDIPDGELGPAWQERDAAPAGFYFMCFFGGSLWMFRTDAYPSRGWWSEQENVNGATPESILRGHWRDLFPSTGPTTGAIATRLADQPSPVMLVFKESAVHYVGGEYPRWGFGTLPTRAGLYGPRLVQNCPDGACRWVGAGTLWELGTDGVPRDVGAPVRRWLERINTAQVHMGDSYIDESNGEVVFLVALDDSELPDWQFVYDYRAGGWRMRNDVQARCAMAIPGTSIVLIAGVYDDETTVWAYGRGYPGFWTSTPEWSYRTAWTGFANFGPDMHAAAGVREAVFTLEERCEGTVTVATRGDWNEDVPNEHGDLALAHPDSDSLAFFGPDADTLAQYDVDVWRSRRIFTHRVAVGEDSVTVCSVAIAGEDPIGIVSIDLYGPKVSGPGTRGPQE